MADPAAPELVAVMGDIHANVGWAASQLPEAFARLEGQDTKVVLQLGDFGFWPRISPGQVFLGEVNNAAADAGGEVWFIDGNHEDHRILLDLASPNGGERIGLGPAFPRVHWLERGHRWTWHDRTWLALGGATSLDRPWRTEGRDVFADLEGITNGEAAGVIAAGPADVMITHDCPAGIEHVFPDLGFPAEEIERAQCHRERLQRVVDAVRPAHLIHGHLHVCYTRDVTMPPRPWRVTGLGCDGGHPPDNWGILNARTMEWV